jgi:hypothetical protein
MASTAAYKLRKTEDRGLSHIHGISGMLYLKAFGLSSAFFGGLQGPYNCKASEHMS